MKRSEARDNVIKYHLKDILDTIEKLSKYGIRQGRFTGLTKDQVDLLTSLGYDVDEYNRNFKPLRIDCSIYWA